MFSMKSQNKTYKELIGNTVFERKLGKRFGKTPNLIEMFDRIKNF